MNPALTDGAGAAVTIEITVASPISSYSVKYLDGGSAVGRADFIDSPVTEGERIFFHTEIDENVGGRGLAGLLVREALADSIREGLTVVPVCPLFARHLEKHGNEFVAAGGAFRRPSRDDMTLLARVTRGGA